MVGVAPAGSDGGEGIGELWFEELIDRVVGGGVEVAGYDGGDAGEGGFLFEGFEGVVELHDSLAAVVGVLVPATALPEAEVGDGLLKMDVEEFEVSSRCGFGSDDLAAVFGNEQGGVDFSPDDDGGRSSAIIAVVSLSSVELVNEAF